MLPKEELLIQPGETVLQGLWIDLGSRMEKDVSWQRIEWLVSEHFEELACLEDSQDCLYRDPTDGRLWELFPVRPELGEQSPPHLAVIAPQTAAERFGVSL